jgi:flagellar M-ring protein FliF
MNYLNQLFEQARSLVMSMTPGARILAGLMLVAIALSTTFLVKDIQQAEMELLFNGHVFKESELQLAETAMSNAGLKKYELDGMRIRVPRSDRDQYIKALASGAATPQQMGSATGKALSSANMLEPMLMTKARILEARQQDLAAALERLPFVDKVFVTYDERREGFAGNSQSTASILVLPRNQMPLNDQQKRSIMHQVKAAFAGLEYKNISVMDLNSGSSMSGDSDPLSTEEQRFYQQKHVLEQRLVDKARNLLSDYGEVKVEANVELDPTLRAETEVLTYQGNPVSIQTSLSKKDSESSRPVAGGRPGTEPNAIANRSDSLATRNEQSSKSKEQQESERKLVGQETTLSEKVGFIIRTASLSVAIPYSYYNLAWRREWQELNPGKALTEAPAMTQADLTSLKDTIQNKIQTSLASLLPEPPPGVNAKPRVTVTDYLDMPVEELPSPSLAKTGLLWLADNWQALGMFLIAGIAILAMRSFVNAGGKSSNDEAFERGFDLPLDDTIDSELAAAQAASASLGLEAGETAADASTRGELSSKRARFTNTGQEIRSELSSLIKENPDMAATLLRSWIGGEAA